MRAEIAGNPDVGDVTFYLDQGEQILCEAGAMSRMSADMNMRTRLMGGLIRSVIRRMFAGESLLVAEYTATADGQHVAVSPAQPGTVVRRKMNGDVLMLTAGSFLACTPSVDLRTRFIGLRSFFSGEAPFFLHASGNGDLYFNSYGAIVEKDVDGEFIVDTGHLVAWEPQLTWRIGGMGGIKQTLFSGEGLVIRFSGKGKVWLQSRHLGGIAGWLTGYCR